MDGRIDILDATLIQKYVVGIVELSAEQKHLADYNNDGDITVCPELWIEDDGLRFALETDTRVGIGYAAPEDQARLWRWKCGAQEGCT